MISKSRYFLFLICLYTTGVKAQSDTLYPAIAHPKPEIQWHHAYHQTLVLKLFMAQAGYDEQPKKKDNGTSQVYLNFEQALEVIKKIDKLTMGIPKIIYLVGWQYNGHDSKYPAWFEVNKRLKRTQDATALASLKWLMKEAKNYHTTISLHINMLDAYTDSPLWQTYVNHDIIARNKDGSLRAGEWGYPVSYAREWQTGYAQKRIDSLCALLPIAEAGTIHIDAFHSWAPIGKKGPGIPPFTKGPISPYLDFTLHDEINAQKNIYKYWASKGIDVTSEGATFLREDNFAGYQPMAWWVDWNIPDYMNWPASYYTGGTDSRGIGRLFGTSMHGEDIVKKDPENLHGFKKDFCTKTLIWYYLNQLERMYFVKNGMVSEVHFGGDVVSRLDHGKLTITARKIPIVVQNDVLIPALWMPGKHWIAYSEKGYKDHEWRLSDEAKDITKLELFEVSILGLKKIGEVPVNHKQFHLHLSADQMVLLRPFKD